MKFRDEKLKYKNINREAAKLLVLSFAKIDKHEEILPPDQKRVIEQAKYTYFSLGKTLKTLIILKTKFMQKVLLVLKLYQVFLET